MSTVSDLAEELYEEAQRTGLSYAEIARRRGLNPNTVRRAIGDFLRRRELPADKQGESPTLDDFIEVAESAQLLWESAYPAVTHMEYKADGNFLAILLAGCFHFGGRWTFHKMARSRLEKALRYDYTRIILLGDEIDNFIAGARTGATSSYEQAISPPLQRIMWERVVNQVHQHVICATTSEHGMEWDRSRGYSPILDIYRRYNIPVGERVYLSVHVGNQTYRIAVSHVFRGSSMYNPTHALYRALITSYPCADVVAQAGRHKSAYSLVPYGIEESVVGNRGSEYAHLVQVGTTKGGPDPYSMRGWERGYTDWFWVCLYGHEHIVKVSNDFRDVLDWAKRAKRLDKQ